MRQIAIGKYIETLMAERSIPGLSVAVVQDGSPVLIAGYGLANVELSVPATEVLTIEPFDEIFKGIPNNFIFLLPNRFSNRKYKLEKQKEEPN